MNEVDLHMHTTASDGTHPPADNVRMAKAAGLYGIAITDHDTVSGVAEAVQVGQELGITVVPGVEISTIEDGHDIHILGYYIDVHNDQLLARLQQLRNTREHRNDMMVERLNELGLTISMEEVMNLAGSDLKGDETIGRPHIAEVLMNKGYVNSISEAFDRYLGKSGAAYVNPPRITPYDAIDWIKAAGGAAVIAHPGLYEDDQLVERIVQYGADGIEVYHSDHSPEEEAKYLAMARKLNCIVTAGSDFHGSRNGHEFHAPIGSKRISSEVLDHLIGKCKS